MNILALSGWGQPHDALATLAPDALHFDYAQFPSQEDVFSVLEGRCFDRVIGWSLGGQLAVEALAKNILRARELVLIATPYQFVQSEGEKLGMERGTYEKFRENYARNPSRTLARAWELVAHHDKHAAQIQQRLRNADSAAVLSRQWTYWFDRLGHFSCNALELSRLPPTLLVHGANDAVVAHAQSGRFLERLGQARLITLDSCGHAPHWHDEVLIREAVNAV